MIEKIGRLLKHILWPHEKNKFQPALVRVEGLLVVLVGLVLFSGLFNLARTGDFRILPYATDVTVAGLFSGTNQQRQSAGLAPFSLRSSLNTAAQNKANHMIAGDYWSHVAPDGTTPWQFIDAVGYLYLKAGENLAYGFLTSSGVINGWMNSAGHRANILDSDFTEVGFGIASGENYQGDENTVVVALYALPYTVSSSPAPAPAAPAPVAPAAPTPPAEEEAPDLEPEVEDSQAGDGPLAVSQLDSSGFSIEIGAPVLPGTVSGKVVSNWEALLRGYAPLSMYVVLGIMMLVGAAYALRHVRAVHRFIVAGEHNLAGHPLLEASIIYVLIWLVLTATYGVII